jgi:hypothetical protein
MATEVIKIVDPDNGSGTNYTSLSAWEAGEQGDLTGARDEIAVAKCRCTGGTADDGSVEIAGWTTDSTRYIKIWTDPSESYRHSGKYSSTKYRLGTKVSTDTYHISITEDFVRIDGLQFYRRTDGGAYSCVYMGFDRTQITDIRISCCVFYQAETHASYSIVAIDYTSSDHLRALVCNNVFIDFNDSSGKAIRAGNWYIDSDNTPWCIFNNTFKNCNGIVSAHDNAALAINNIFYSCTTPCSGVFASGTGYNSTDESSIGYTVTGGATADRVSQTFSFVDASGDDFHLQSTDGGARGYGLNLYNHATYPIQTDIDGQDRGGSGASWDIGADEVITVGGIPPWMLSRTRAIQHLMVR